MDVAEWKGKIDFGIITIREDEFDAVLQRLPDRIGIARGRRAYNLRRMDLSGSATYTLAVIRCLEQGNGEALDAARDLLEELAPRWLLVTGIAGGAPAHEFTLGDVVVSTRIIDFSVEAILKDGSHEYAISGGPIHREAAILAANLLAIKAELGPWSVPESIGVLRPRVDLLPENFYGGAEWQQKVRKALEYHFGDGERIPKVTAGALASSDRLVKDAERIQVWLRVARQFLAIEMESGGVHRAAQGRNVPFLAIRGISDIIGFNRDPAWTAYACHSAAAFTLAFLRTRPIPVHEGILDQAPGRTLASRLSSPVRPASYKPANPGSLPHPRDSMSKADPLQKQMSLDGYTILHTVYQGHYSEVFRVRAADTGGVCVVKRSQRGRVSIRALEKLAALGCGNVLAPRRIWQDTEHVYEEMPYIGGTRLSQAIVRGAGGLTGSVLECLCDQLGSTLRKLRGAGLIHRDVHPDNIFLLTRPAAQGASFLREFPGIEYGVFGGMNSQFLVSFVLVDSTFLITSDEAATAAPVGHGNYTPPEQLRRQPTAESDLYALGATIYFGITGREIPSAARRVFDPSALGPLPNGSHSSHKFSDLLETLLSLDPAQRSQDLWCEPDSVVSGFTGLLPLLDGTEVLVIDQLASDTETVRAAELAARLQRERERAAADLASIKTVGEWYKEFLAEQELSRIDTILYHLYRALPVSARPRQS